MPQQTTLTPAAVMTASRMYEEKDSRGRRIHSYRTIANFLGCSETTVMRAVTRSGPYKALPQVLPEGQMDLAAQESLARLLKDNPGLVEQSGAEPNVVDKLTQDIARKREELGRGDSLLDELKGEKK